MRHFGAAVFGALLISSFASSACLADEWIIDRAHSSANFEIKHLMFSSVNGKFADISGIVDFDGKALDKASVDAAIGAGSIDTQMSARDKHIREAFEVQRIPQITFKSKRVVPTSNGSFDIQGTLSMHGVSRDVVLKASPLAVSRDAQGRETLATVAVTELNRKDYGITVDKAIDRGGAVIGDNVKVTLNITLQHK